MRLLENSAVFCRERNLNSEIDCFHSTSKTLGYLENQHPNIGLALLAMMITDLCDTFNIGKNMSGAQVINCAMMILTEYRELKIDDVALCFNKIKMGRYGKIYDRLDAAVIFECVERFIADKTEQVEYFWQHQQNVIGQQNKTPLLQAAAPVDDKTAISHIKRLKQQVISAQVKRHQQMKITRSVPVKPNMIHEIHQMFIRWFTSLYNREVEILMFQELPVPRGTRFITCCGKQMDVGEYIQKKHLQLIGLYRKINFYWGIQDPEYPAYVAPRIPERYQGIIRQLVTTSNHEVWVICPTCKKEYDARSWVSCPTPNCKLRP